MKIKITAMKGVLKTIGFLQGSRYKHSQEYEDNFKYMGTPEKLWWAYKALVKQCEKGERGKGIEEYFSAQDLSFPTEAEFKVESKFTITAGGDLSCSEVITPESTMHLWDDVEDFYFSADMVCANLEAAIDTSKPESFVPSVCLTAPKLNTSPEMFQRFTKDGKGVNFFSTANNHSLDMGAEGLAATLDFLDARGYGHIGTARTIAEQADIPVIEKNGIRVAYISYTYCLNGCDPILGKEYLTNDIRLNKPDTDISLIKQHVKIAKDKKADIIIAMLHWSVEFETYPIENVMKMGHRIIESGVDIILGGHPHVAQPMEKYKYIDSNTGQQKEGFIIYSLGELVSYNAFSRNSRLAFLLKLELSKGAEKGIVKTKHTDIRVMPIYTWIRKLESGSWDYRILDFHKTIKKLDAGQNPYSFDKMQHAELQRLNELLHKKLLPENQKGLLYEEKKEV